MSAFIGSSYQTAQLAAGDPGHNPWLRGLRELFGDAFRHHVRAGGLRLTEPRAVWGTWLLVMGAYGMLDVLVRCDAGIAPYVACLVHDTSGPASVYDMPFIAWCMVALFGCVWVVVGVHRSNMRREVMGPFWPLCCLGVSTYLFVSGTYLANVPAANWYLQGCYLATLVASVMATCLYVRAAPLPPHYPASIAMPRRAAWAHRQSAAAALRGSIIEQLRHEAAWRSARSRTT